MNTTGGIRNRLWVSLDTWCRGLAGALHPVGDGLASLTPLPESGEVAYDAVAGDQFAAAAAGYWLARADASAETAAALRKLIRFALVSHVSAQERVAGGGASSKGRNGESSTKGRCSIPEGAVWGATAKHRSNDWHASLFTAATGLLLDGALTGEEKEQLRRAIEWEADFHARHPPGMENLPPIRGRKWPARNPAQSCGESLAWTTALLQVARIRFPDASGAGRWREASIAHALNAMSFPGDLGSDRQIAGRPLSAWVVGANFEPGGIQEHHGFYHPGYMAWPLASHAVAFLLDEQLPGDQRDPDVFLHHWQDVFERLKQSCLDNGRLIYAAGFDWNQFGYGNTRLLPAALFAAGHYGDALAARIADGYLGLMEFQQERTGWAFQAERMATQRKLFPNRYAWYEAIDGMTLAESHWILGRLVPLLSKRPTGVPLLSKRPTGARSALPEPASVDAEGVAKIGGAPSCRPMAAGSRRSQDTRATTSGWTEPASAETFFLQTRGTYVEPGAALAWLRTDKVFASFSGRAYPGGIQALVQPLEKPHLLKWNGVSSGVLEIEGASPMASLKGCTIRAFDGGGFFAIAELTHGRWVDGRNIRPLARQWLAVVALADGTVLWFDRCRAEQECVLETNLALPVRLAADIFNGERARLRAGDEDLVFGQHPNRDTWHSLDGRALVFDDSLAIQNLEGEGAFHLLQKRRRDTEGKTMLYGEGPAACEESLVSHDLWFGRRDRLPAAEGKWIRRVSHVLTCESPLEPVHSEDIARMGGAASCRPPAAGSRRSRKSQATTSGWAAIELKGEPLAFSVRCGDSVRLSIQLADQICRLL